MQKTRQFRISFDAMITDVPRLIENIVTRVPGASYVSMTNIKFDAIREWANERGLIQNGNSITQVTKLFEEGGELAAAILRDDKPKIQDAIGDCVVVLTNLASINGWMIEDCIAMAYEEIKNRKGRTCDNGNFLKDE